MSLVERLVFHMKRASLFFPCLISLCSLLHGQDGIATKTTYAKAYGPTNNEVMVDPARDLPRYPAVAAKDAIHSWQVKKGFKLELAACEPLVRDPIAISFDERGRMFVCEMIDYSEMRDVTPHLGRVSMLEDKDGDGFYETGTVFADDLPWPTGLIWANGGLYVGATPDIWRFEDRDGDGKAEVREKVFTGFGTGLKIINVQGMMNSFQWGQDNRIHVLAGGGNRGVIHRTGVPPGRAEESRMTAPTVSGKMPDPPEIELGGKDFWFDPLTLDFGLEAGGAQYGMSFDDFGRKYGCSNSVHLQAWLYEDDYAGRNPYFNIPPARSSIAVDGGAAEVFRISPDEPWRIIRTRWRVAGVVKGAVEGGGRVSGYFTGATGTTIYRGDAYGPEFVNNSFTGDAGGQLIHRKIIRPAADGITLEAERPEDERGFEFAASNDTWVRVVNFANAPDGCLHVCDMYREVIEHPWSIPDEIKKHLDLNSGNDRGRIWRIVPEGPRPARIGQKTTLHQASAAELVGTLSHPNGWHRDTAHRLLTERAARGELPADAAALLAGEGGARLHGLGILAGTGRLGVGEITKALADPSAPVRERACRLAEKHILSGKDTDVLMPAMLNLADTDPAPRVRFQALLSLGNLGAEAPSDLDRVFAAASQDSNATLRLAVLGAPPALVSRALFIRLEKDGLTGLDTLAPMIQTAAALKDGTAHQRLLSIVAEAPAEARAPLLQALASGLRSAGTSIVNVDAAGRLTPVFTQAAATVQDAAQPEKARLQSIELLALAGKDQAQPALLACLTNDTPVSLQTAAIRALGSMLGTAANALILTAGPALQPQAREAALAFLLSREEGVRALLAAMQQPGSAKVWTPAALAASQVQALIAHKNTRLASEARTVLKEVIPPSREEVAATFAPAINLKGDATAGQNHYIGRCMACHSAQGLGIEVGPDLITVKTKGREALLTAILDPHKEVASQYIAYTISTKEGQTLSGIITHDDASSLTLKMMGGASVSLERSAITGTTSNGQSLMPEGLEAGMSPQDMADLLAFIEQL